jgi:hypothetical protein
MHYTSKEIRESNKKIHFFLTGEKDEFRKSGIYDINGIEIREGSIINVGKYKSDIENKYFHCVEFCDGKFGSDVYSDFDDISRYKKIEVIAHISDDKIKEIYEIGDWAGNLGACIRTFPNYHEDIKLLFDVIDKIDSMGYITRIISSPTVSGKWISYSFDVDEAISLFKIEQIIRVKSEYEQGESKISTIWRGVLEFIDWYNENKKQ